MPLTIILAAWGAILSTVLFIFRVNELRKNSLGRFSTDFHMDSYNKVITISITNFSNYPINICYYEAYFTPGKFSKNKLFIDSGLQGDLINIQVKPHERYKLTYDEAYYFNPYLDKYRGQKLFLELNVIGKKRAIRKKIKL
jgi:hypothetical protein